MKTRHLFGAAPIVSAAAAIIFASSPANAHHVSISGPAGDAGPITTVSPETLSKGSLAAGFEIYVEDYDAFRDEELLEFAEEDIEGVHNTDAAYVASLGLECGVADNLSVSLTLPFLIRDGIREAEHHEGDGDGHGAHPEIEALGTATGIGDLQLGLKYRLLERSQNGLSLALLAGVSIPTGENNQLDNEGGRFESEFQPGSGSWDPRVGLSIGKSIGPVSADANALYTHRTEGSQATNLGDHLAFNAALSWRLGKGSHYHDDGTFERHQALDLILEVNGEWEERERVGLLRDANSGGTQILLAPGVRYSSANGWALFSSVGIPIHEDLNGIQNNTDVRFKFGISLSI